MYNTIARIDYLTRLKSRQSPRVLVTLPPDFIYAILDSIHFSSHDLAHIALAHRNFLSFARHNLYNHVEIRIEREVLGVLAGDGRPGSVAMRIRRPQPLGTFLLKTSLHSHVQKIYVNGDTFRRIGEMTSVTALKMILDTVLSVEILVLNHWLWLTPEVSNTLIEQQRRRTEDQPLSIHVKAAYDTYDEENGGFEVPLSSFDASSCASVFNETVLTASRSSLRAVGFYIRLHLRYQVFSNVTILRIGVNNFGASNLISHILESFKHFQKLRKLTLVGDRDATTGISALLHILTCCLPTTLRQLSLVYDFESAQVEKIVQALPGGTTLQQLHFCAYFEGPAMKAAVAKVNAGRSNERVQITVDDQRRQLWEDLCMFCRCINLRDTTLTCLRPKQESQR